MMVLKETEVLSAQKIFENWRFKMLTRSAICLLNTDDCVPTELKYYLFRKCINDHATAMEGTEISLMKPLDRLPKAGGLLLCLSTSENCKYCGVRGILKLSFNKKIQSMLKLKKLLLKNDTLHNRNTYKMFL